MRDQYRKIKFCAYALLLVLVFALNFTAIRLRKRLHEKYAMKGF